MTNSMERELDLLIDSLNREQKPKQQLDPEAADMLAIVKAVKSLNKPPAPNRGFGQKITETVTKRSHRRRMLIPFAAIAAGLLLFITLANLSGLLNDDPVYAMEKAIAKLSNYHGILEMRTVNADGEEWMVRRVEIWSVGDKYALLQNDDVLTVNSGERKWQVNPQNKEVALLPLVPDPKRNHFDLQDEAKRAKQYPYTVSGTDMIAGRRAIKLEISPPGGLPYYLWIDAETDLPVKLQTAMHNALSTTYTFVEFEPNTDIDPTIFSYQQPEGYKIVEQDPGQLVATIEEAVEISGLKPLLPQEAPERIFAFNNRIVLDYGETTVVETPAEGDFEPLPNSTLGTAAGGPLEVFGESLKWRQNGMEIRIEGSGREELARQIAPDLSLPDTDESLTDKAQVKVDVDMEIVKADQQQVDGGHIPWQLHPLMVASTFVNLQITPDGIVGEPSVPEQAFTLGANNGSEAIVDVSAGPIKRVYLKRLIRQDETGIWSVVGYDPR
jgi:outer membrane lipoprotein-sorting protein